VDSDHILTKDEFWKLMEIKSPLTNPYTVKMNDPAPTVDENGVVTVVLKTSGAGSNDLIVAKGGQVKITYKIKIK